MEKRLINKRLVNRLMDKRHIVGILVARDLITIEVDDKFTPAMAISLMKELGQENEARLATNNGSNFIILNRR